MSIKMLSRGLRKGAGGGSVIRAQIPYIKADIPILILFRALGAVVSTGLTGVSTHSQLDEALLRSLRCVQGAWHKPCWHRLNIH